MIKKSKILVTESDPMVKKFSSLLEKSGHEVIHIDNVPSTDQLLSYKDVDVLSVFVWTKVTKEVIDGLPNLKLITIRATGIDNIDVRAAAERNVAVANVPGYGNVPVAEHTFALLLALIRKIVQADASVRAGLWETSKFQGTQIFGKNFGVMGTGAIGANVCRLAKAFGANVIAYDVIKREDVAREIGFSYVELDDLLRKSDIISIHVPLTKETYHLVNSDMISKMKDGVIIVNAARGPIIDYKALIKALKSGKVAGAGLDVFEPEPPESGSELLKLDNVVLTPHIAWNTVEAENYILEVTINAIREFLAGGRPKNIITRD